MLVHDWSIEMSLPYTAYLVVICDKETNAVKSAVIWSSPEWEQSICLPYPTFVAYEVNGKDYQTARNNLVKGINQPRSRYNWLVKYLEREI